ncbi:TadE/TadG family type IV pilus assembly protein [Bacillus songklensis]|uniref:TadE/TadG family type IV pilus assembly protein n=1 Tax=Bacillus songklensis TaxID=1069116 RepID=A0ABV8B502_9BACI
MNWCFKQNKQVIVEVKAMRLWKKRLTNEKGSASIEFLGMVPLLLLLFVMLWQFLVVGYALIVTHSAVNEGAKVFAVTEDPGQASAKASDVISKVGSSIRTGSFTVNNSGDPDFTAVMQTEVELVFLPADMRKGLPAIPIKQEATSRVIQ